MALRKADGRKVYVEDGHVSHAGPKVAYSKILNLY
jgi:hypothetical protein